MAKKSKMQFYPVAMTVAGSDSGGGAGIAADLRTFNALGVFGTCAISAVTAQNPAAVRRIDPLPAAAITAQIDAVMEKIAVKYCKSGMLFSTENIVALAASVKKHQLRLICDPVMVSTSGSKLLQDDAIEAVKSELLGLAAWLTPNIPEAELLCNKKITTIDDMLLAAASLGEKYSASILLKGGHLNGKNITDVVCRDGKLYTVSSPSVQIPPLASHGTGCTLSAAMTAMFALDLPWKQVICESKAFVYGSLVQTVEIGAGTIAMYPPSEDSIHLIRLEEVENC